MKEGSWSSARTGHGAQSFGNDGRYGHEHGSDRHLRREHEPEHEFGRHGIRLGNERQFVPSEKPVVLERRADRGNRRVAEGHLRTRLYVRAMSALPPKADH